MDIGLSIDIRVLSASVGISVNPSCRMGHYLSLIT